jgi:outer membrane protein OmpA-like peptidoglycan-associated protein
MNLAHVLAEDSMREPTPEIMRDVSARLSRPRQGQHPKYGTAEPFGGIHGTDGEHPEVSAFSQHFDIFAREQQMRPASWVICWSDLMMTMFIMFAALYIFQLPKIQYKSVSELSVQALPLGTETIPPQALAGSILERLHDRLRDLIARDGLQDMVAVQSIPGKSLHVVLSGDLLFEKSRAVLRGDVKETLLAVGEILRSAPHALSVVGHAASGGVAAGSREPWELSVAMAADVADFLIRDAGLPAERMLVAGYGDQRPLVDGDGAGTGWRVELVLSSENPTEPLPMVKAPAGEGFRQWLAASKQGGQ